MTARILIILLVHLSFYSFSSFTANKGKKAKVELTELLNSNTTESKRKLNEIRRMNGYKDKNPSAPNNSDIGYLLFIHEAKGDKLFLLAMKFKDGHPQDAAEYLAMASDKGFKKAIQAMASYGALTSYATKNEKIFCDQLITRNSGTKKSALNLNLPFHMILEQTKALVIDTHTRNADEQFILAARAYYKFTTLKPRNIQHKQKATDYLKLAAAQNHNYAICQLFALYKHDKSRLDDAKKLALDLAEKGVAVGQYELANFYLSDLQMPNREEEAKKLFKLAANQGFELAKRKLNDKTNVVDLSQMLDVLSLEDNGQNNEAPVEFDTCLNSQEQMTLSQMQENDTLKLNTKTLLKRMAKDGDKLCQYRLALSYSNGSHDFSKNEKKSKEWMSAAAENGCYSAKAFLASTLLQEYLKTPSISNGTKIYQLLNEVLHNSTDENELCETRHLLYYCILSGIGTPRNIHKANDFAHSACLQGDNWAAFASTNEPSKAMIEKDQINADINGDTEALVKMGIYYLIGNGINADINRSIAYFKIAAEKGSGMAKSNLNLLNMLEKGQLLYPIFFLDEDGKECINAWDNFLAALCHLRGIGVEKNAAKGKALLLHVCSNWNTEIAKILAKVIIRQLPADAYLLSLTELNDLGQKLKLSSPKKSFAVFVYAAYLGDRDSQYELGKYFQKAPPRDEFVDLDIFWFKVAEFFGHDGAHLELDQIRKKKQAQAQHQTLPLETKKRSKHTKAPDAPKVWMPMIERAPIEISPYNPQAPLEIKSAEDEFQELLRAANNHDSAAAVKLGCIYFKNQDFNLAKTYFFEALADASLDTHNQSVALRKMQKIDPNFKFDITTINGYIERHSTYRQKFCHAHKKLFNPYEIALEIEDKPLETPPQEPVPAKETDIIFIKAPLYQKNIETMGVSQADENDLLEKLKYKPLSRKIMPRMNGFPVMKKYFHINKLRIGRVAYIYDAKANSITLLSAIQKGLDDNFPREYELAMIDYLTKISCLTKF